MYFLAIVVLLASSAHSQRIDDARLREAERLYLAQEYHQAIDLLSVSGLFGAVPVLDRLGPEKRAGLLFDVSRLQYASGDGERAEKTLAFLFGLAPNASSGLLQLPEDEHLSVVLAHMALLRIDAENRMYASRTTTSALIRNSVVPGWGQFYRGRKKAGRIYGAAALIAGVGYAVSYKSYRDALDTYNDLRAADLNRDPGAFSSQYDIVESRSSRSNLFLGVLAGIWVASTFDNVIIGPRRAAVVIPLGN